MFGVSVRSTSAGLSRPGWRCSRSAWPTESWIASGAASTSVSIAAAHVLDPGQHRGFAGHAVVDGDVEAAA
jgi:hypothetical protein